MGPGVVGQDVAFEPKDSLKLKKKKNLLTEFPKCLHHILPLSDPIFMLLHRLGQRLKGHSRFREGGG